MNNLLRTIILLLAGFTLKAQSGSNSEVFIQVKAAGKYTISLNGDEITSQSGKFRFYDVPARRVSVTVMQGGKVLQKSELQVQRATRVLADFSRGEGLMVKDELPVFDRGYYALDNWDGVIGRGGNGGYERPGNNSGYERQGRRVFSEQEFNSFIQALKKENFEKDKIRFLQLGLKNSLISSSQLAGILESFSFDETKLTVAMNSFGSVYDPENIHLLMEKFAFSSSKEKFSDFVLKHPGGQAGHTMPGKRLFNEQEFNSVLQSLKNESFDKDKIAFLQLSLKNAWVTSGQLLRILENFSFDEAKLTVIMNSFDSVYDTENIYKVRDKLSFSSSREKLDEFLLKQ